MLHIADLHDRTEPRPTSPWPPGSRDERFADHYRQWYPAVVGLCRRYLGHHADAESMAQEVFARAWESWPRFTDERPFWPWVSTIARRLCINELTTRRRRAELLPRVPVDIGPPDPGHVAVEGAADSEAVRQALASLAPRQRRVLRMRDLEGWSYEDIAAFDGMTVEAVRGTLKRARASFRRLYDDVATGALGVWGLVLRILHGWRTVPLGTRLVGSELAVAALAALLVSPPSAIGELVVPTPPVVDAATAAGIDASEGRRPLTTSSTGGSRTAALPAATVPVVVDPQPGDGIQDARVEEYTVSPSYHQDRTVFATAWAEWCATSLGCPLLFKSEDGGTTWRRLPATGLQQGRVLLPPSYPRDNRIFAVSSTYLSVSDDGGSTFRLVTPVQGEAAMSPLFSSGDPRILFTSTLFYPASVAIEYHDNTGRVAPMPLVLPNGAAASNFAFSPTYETDDTMLIGAGRADLANLSVGTVVRCRATTCEEVLATSGREFGFRLLWTRGPRTSAFAFNYREVFVSLDGGRSFQARSVPGDSPHRFLRSLAESADGRLLLSVAFPDTPARLYASEDDGATWTLVSSATGDYHKLTPLPDGRLLSVRYPKGAECSADGGRTWASRCPG